MKDRFYIRVMMTVISLALAGCISLAAQTISPVSSVFVGGGKGDLVLTNNSLDPMIVTMEVVNFQVGDGKKIVRSKLDPHTHIKLSKSGLRIAPQDKAHVFFDASADTYPAWCMIYATFRQEKRHPGFNMVMQLGHPVYMYQKESIKQGDVAIQTATYNPATHKLMVAIENNGDKLARPFLSFPQLRDSQYKLRFLPVFPHTTTSADFDLSMVDVMRNVVVDQLLVEFDHFKLSSPVKIDEAVVEKSTVSSTTPAPGQER